MFAYPVVKGGIMAVVVLAIVRSHTLSTFDQAIIIAVISATISSIGIVLGAIIGARATRPVLERQDTAQRDMQDVKAAVGAAKRKGDVA